MLPFEWLINNTPMTTIEMIKNLPSVIILYPAGASGEFIAYALTNCIGGTTQTETHWEDGNRCKYFDLYDRCLNSGFDSITTDMVIESVDRFSQLLDRNIFNTISFGLAHPRDSSLAFINQYLSNVPIIQIVVNNTKSKMFVTMAAHHKIHKTNILSVENCKNRTRYINTNQYHGPNPIIKVEWEDMLLTNTEETFSTIEKFLNVSGNVTKFQELVETYIEKNNNILSIINAG
jgi:hypothetical protein